MRAAILLAIMVALSACTRGPSTDRVGMAADAITTGFVIADSGLKEGNPALGFLNNMDPVAAAATVFALKVGIEKVIDYSVKDDPRFEPDFAKNAMNATGSGAACWNAMLLGGAAAAPPIAFLAIGCAVADWKWRHFAFSFPWDTDQPS